MKKYKYTVFVSTALFMCAGSGRAGNGIKNTASSQPNIIYLMADDLGYGDFSCYGADKIKTPHVDALAQGGIRLTDAHSPASVCTPTRYAVLTGRYCWRGRLKKGVLWSAYDRLLIEKGRKTIGNMMQEKGYHTAQIGKWHLGWGDTEPVDFSTGILGRGPKDLGFDYSFITAGAQNMAPIVFVENHKVMSKLKTPDCYVYDPQIKGDLKKSDKWKKYTQWYKKKNGHMGPELVAEDWEPYRVDEIFCEKAVAFIKNHQANHPGKPFYLHFTPEAPHLPNIMPERFRGASQISDRVDHVLFLDWIIGQITATVKELGIEENTLIIVTSDNGATGDREASKAGHHANGKLKGTKRTLPEGGHRVPFIAVWPARIKAGTQSDTLICLTDMMATFAAITGYKLDNEMGEDSFNALPVLLGEERIIRDTIMHHSLGGQFAIRQGKWKYYGGGKKDPNHLYDMEKDYCETTNLADQYPEIVDRLKAVMQKEKDAGRTVLRTAP